ncbi:MAG TPA: delta-60 repeat domain-containing protein [Rudaea sp.]|nr:delta-60 repeat domain-containing protein [Rudaea sp.]
MKTSSNLLLAQLLCCLLYAFMPAAFAQAIDAFNPSPDTPPATLAIQADGKILLAGNFLDIGIVPRERIARFTVDGSLDATFADPHVDSNIDAIAVQADGKILIGGYFSALGATPRHNLARLNSDGTVDTTFADPDLNGNVWAIAIQPSDGKILVAGDFTMAAATSRRGAARLNTNGTLDTSFADPNFDPDNGYAPVRCIALQADGHVLIGGSFSQVGSTSHFYFARFSSSGVFDPTFPAGNEPQVAAIVVAPDGSIFVADPGAEKILKYSPIGVADPSYVSALADGSSNGMILQPNAKIVIGGTFENVAGQPHHALARLNANGSLDTGFGDLQFRFDATNPNGYIYGVAAQTDGKDVAIGNFLLVNGQARQFVARVASNDTTVNILSGQPSGGSVIVTWTRAGAGPELALSPILMHSTDGVHFSADGAMSRIATGWQKSAPYNVNGAPFYLRASGFTSSGAGNGSLGSINSPVFVSDRIFANGFE